jgi:DNA polymerase V
MNDQLKDKEKKAGGLRGGSGRKIGTGKFGEATSVVRIPTSQAPVIHDFLTAYEAKKKSAAQASLHDVSIAIELPLLNAKPLFIPLYSSKVAAGFPSPADDHIEARLNPNDYLVDCEEATIFNTVKGDSMIEAGIYPGDKLVVDRSRTPVVGDIIVAYLYGEPTVKYYKRQKNGNPILYPANPAYQPIPIEDGMEFELVGVVIGSFRRFKKKRA